MPFSQECKLKSEIAPNENLAEFIVLNDQTGRKKTNLFLEIPSFHDLSVSGLIKLFPGFNNQLSDSSSSGICYLPGKETGGKSYLTNLLVLKNPMDKHGALYFGKNSELSIRGEMIKSTNKTFL